VEYDEERELTRHVWDFYGRLMTPFEQRVGWAHLAEGKAAAGYHAVSEFILRTRGIAGDPEAEAALADGVEALRWRVCDRVLAQHGPDVYVIGAVSIVQPRPAVDPRRAGRAGGSRTRPVP
jgi:hypothetical protein